MNYNKITSLLYGKLAIWYTCICAHVKDKNQECLLIPNWPDQSMRASTSPVKIISECHFCVDLQLLSTIVNYSYTQGTW